MRTLQHIIDSRSVKHVVESLPDEWVIRQLTERDYGTDLMVELFDREGVDGKGHDRYRSTGAVLHIQVKGTDAPLKKTRAGTVNVSVDKRILLYAESFSAPFVLFRVTTAPGSPIYFVWLQRYIKSALDLQCAGWRTAKQHSFTLRIPVANQVQTRLEKLGKIASRPKYIEELVEFRDIFGNVVLKIEARSAGRIKFDNTLKQNVCNEVRRLRQMRTLLKFNECCIDRSCVDDLITFVNRALSSNATKKLADLPHLHNFSLLRHSITSLAGVEDFVAENEHDTAY